MWKIILLVIFGCIVGSKCRVANSFDSFPFGSSSYNVRSDNRINEDPFRQFYFFYRPSKRGESYRNYDLALAVPQTKRAFSMLARWRPFNSIGKNRSSIREHNNFIAAKPIVDFDIVRADTRALPRPIGQPLRWG